MADLTERESPGMGVASDRPRTQYRPLSEAPTHSPASPAQDSAEFVVFRLKAIDARVRR